MQNRRDQVQAHSFVVGRLVSALLRAEPDSIMTPLRRFVVGTVCGILLGSLALAGCGVYGIFSPGGSKTWRQPGVLVVEKETGARYVFVDGQLRPVLNYTSARLILGGAPSIASVSRKSLVGVPHGLPIGIVAAPDYLPDPGKLNGTRWRVCSTLRPDSSGADHPFVTLDIGPESKVRATGAEGVLIVRTPSGQLYAAWNNLRLRVPSAGILAALGYASAPQHPVGWSWINALPAGPDLVAPDVPGRGEAGKIINGRQSIIGQIYRVPGEGGKYQHFVARADGLSPLTAWGAALMVSDPQTAARAYAGGRVETWELSSAALAAAPQSSASSINPGHPQKAPLPVEVRAGEAPCLNIAMQTDQGPTVQVGLGTPPAIDAKAKVAGDRSQADYVVVTAAAGLLIRELPAPGVLNGTVYLLTDNGLRYPIPNVDAIRALGYANSKAVPVPASILNLLPAGRPLDPAAARATVPFAPPTSGPEGSAA